MEKMDVTQVLLNAQSADPSVRSQAEQQIEAAKSQNLPLLMSLMAGELANEQKEVHVRQGAGLLLKNCLVAKEEARVQQQQQQWVQMDAATKQQIKTTVLSALASPSQAARHTAAQVVAAIGIIELPLGHWDDLIEGLVANVSTSGNNCMKHSSLEALGFICEQIDPEILEKKSNVILTAVVQGMRKEETDDEVRLAATRALLNALEFVRTNFENESERNYIMQTVCEATQAERKELKLAAFECIVHIAELYYDKLAPYIEALYHLTLQTIRTATANDSGDDDEVGQQAVELWSTICEEELELMEDEEIAHAAQRQPERANQQFVLKAVDALVPLLLEALCKQEDEDLDDDTWNIAMAAASCLAKIAQVVEDKVVQHVMPFIQTHINSGDWRRREAATLAFGSILEGPSQDVLAPFMPQAIDKMISLMADPSVAVKDTAAWAIGRICEHHIQSISPAHWQEMMRPGEASEKKGVLLAGLEDAPRVASNVCWALHNLADHCEDTRSDPTNTLSPLFVSLARALLVCTERPDAGEHNLRCSAYEALNTTLTNSADDTRPSIEQLLPVVLKRLQDTFEMQVVSNDDREAQNELQGLLCGTLQVITQKLGSMATQFADSMMQLFLQVFGAKNSTVHEEALMAVGAVANATELGFEKYMPHFRPFLSLGLSNYEEHQVCSVAVGVVGDICRALEGKILPYCDEIVHLLLRNLQNTALKRNVKPPILSCFGDIALAVGGAFETYMQATMTMLSQAACTTVDMNNPELVEYLNQLREGILDAYTGVLQGLKGDEKSAAFEPYVMSALDLLRKVAEEHDSSSMSGDDVLRASVGVVGDLASSLGPRFKTLARQQPHVEYIQKLIKEARSSKLQEATKQVGNWAQQAIA